MEIVERGFEEDQTDVADVAAVADVERPRKIIHVDMDAFFASVEQRDDPALRGKPIAVGGSRERGVVAAASYEARIFGVRSAMPSVTARRKCPDLVFVKPRFEVYKAVSQQIRTIFAEHTPVIEPLSLDEAYLDVTENLQGLPLATDIAKAIRARIHEETCLTASAGVSYNKFLAKLASDQRKPNGLFVIPPDRGAAFVEGLPIGRFHGIGPATEAKMLRLGIASGADLRERPLAFLQQHFGKAGAYYFGIARGIDYRPVRANRIRKSVGAENTFADDLVDYEPMREALQPILDKVWRHCEVHGTRGRTVTLKVKFSDFTIITRSRSVAATIDGRDALEAVSLALLRAEMPVRRSVRLLGVSLSSLTTPTDGRPMRIVATGSTEDGTPNSEGGEAAPPPIQESLFLACGRTSMSAPGGKRKVGFKEGLPGELLWAFTTRSASSAI